MQCKNTQSKDYLEMLTQTKRESIMDGLYNLILKQAVTVFEPQIDDNSVSPPMLRTAEECFSSPNFQNLTVMLH